MADRKMTQLAAPEAAIASYLDDLLQTATSSAREDEPVIQEPASVAEPVVVATPEPVRVVAEPALTPEPEPTGGADKHEAEPPARPDWSGEPFECLIFTVAGLQLAVPLVLLGAVHRIEEEIRSLPGSPRWYMGIRPDRDHNLRVVDTAEWIMAGRVPEGVRDNYRFVIRLDNSEWGLACDEVAQSFTLKPEEVKWRTARSKRPWLAGTVVDHMCALIDVRTMAHLLARAEQEHHLDLS
ncbi:chemotaxis protein CheW [Marinobacter daepoensis]|uniref:chemotaxis protein CheW n=1 Tax=Marinobacter daepoensis TaxID=262077 RepID=UPI001C98B2FF|nr:chemotaxis protein CheW [Marinobacter daepoensis]MBY6031750.1 chemotaxis protein CheW [Marinobacter daepoensis]